MKAFLSFFLSFQKVLKTQTKPNKTQTKPNKTQTKPKQNPNKTQQNPNKTQPKHPLPPSGSSSPRRWVRFHGHLSDVVQRFNGGAFGEALKALAELLGETARSTEARRGGESLWRVACWYFLGELKRFCGMYFCSFKSFDGIFWV